MIIYPGVKITAAVA